MRQLENKDTLFAEKILEHCLDISNGVCNISELDLVNAESDLESQVLFGLFCMHEEIQSNSKEKEERIKIELESKLLKEKNRELEEFAYKASHDLKEPIRTVFSFSQILKNMLEGTDNPKIHNYLEYIQVSTKRMTDMISNLLEYARFGNQVKFETVDTQVILQNVHFDLITQLQKVKGKLIVGNMPEIIGDPTLLRLIFQNLISNSLKFSRQGVIPVVEVEGLVKPNEYQFSVKDNGIGMSKYDAADIFDIYKRSNAAEDQYEGTGIGLAHCKKIIDLHRGKIWVKSEVGKGSTFYFTINKKLS